MAKKLTTKVFIEKAKQIHGDKYDYSKVEYVNNRTKVCIICPTHGEFWQIPKDHLKGHGCKLCIPKKRKTHGLLLSKRLTTEEFIERANEIHGKKYDYSNTNYKISNEKVSIICPQHGEFWQLPYSHLNGHGCPLCSKNKHYTTIEFIEAAKRLHNNKYDYSKVNYINATTKVCIICPIHGEFWQSPYAHLQGNGCPKCKGISIRNKKVKTLENFINDAIYVHGNKYDYSKVEYVNANTKVCIICPIHGEFWQTPSKHLQGHGCQLCHSSKLEDMVAKFLLEKNIEFEQQKIFGWLKSKQNFLRLDFYIPKYNVAIECQGIQHYKPVDFNGKGYDYSNKTFELTKQWDELKKTKCLNNKIRLLYFSNEEIKKEVKNENLITNLNILLENIIR